MKIEGDKIYLRLLSPTDVGNNYVEWLSDNEITEFLEIRWKVFTLEDLKEYVRAMNESSHDFLFGIFVYDSGKHIGNIKIGEINPLHRFGDIGLIIGNKDMWGKGYGVEAIKLATSYGFKELNLNKLKAGMYENNIGSYKAFLKAGYKEVGRYKQHRFYKGRYVGEILLEVGREEINADE